MVRRSISYTISIISKDHTENVGLHHILPDPARLFHYLVRFFEKLYEAGLHGEHKKDQKWDSALYSTLQNILSVTYERRGYNVESAPCSPLCTASVAPSGPLRHGLTTRI